MRSDGHWLNEERLRVYPRLFLALFVLAALGYAATFRDGIDFAGRTAGADFVTFWAASSLVLEGDAVGVFDPTVMQARESALWPGSLALLPWFYPPTMLLFVTPLALVPYGWSFLTFVVGSLASFVVSLRRLVPERGGWWLVAAFPGLWISLAQGQPSLFTAALAGGGLHLREKRPLLAGLLLGLLAIKPQLAILLPVVLIAEKNWTTLLATAASALALLGLSSLVLGPQCLPAWVSSLQIATTALEAGAFKVGKMPTLFAWLFGAGVPTVVALGLQLALAALAVGGLLLIIRRRASARLIASATVLATFVVLPYSFDYDLAWLAFPLAWLAAEGSENGWRRGDRELLVALWVLPLVLGAAGLLHLPLGAAVLAWGLVQVWRRARAHGTPVPPSSRADGIITP